MTEPYYQGERATLYLGDCRTVVPTLPRQSVDLLIADPPYGVQWQSGRRTERFEEMAGDSDSMDWPDVLGTVVRHALRLKRHVYVFGYPEDRLVRPMQLSVACPLVWNKGKHGAGNLVVPWGQAHEPLTFGVMAHRPFETDSGQGGLAARLRRGSVLSCPSVNGGAVTRHPSEKPVALLRELIESSSRLGETVLDPVCGVGSTVVAAVLAGRRAVGIELDERYLSIAVDRVREAERIAKLAEVV